MIIRQIIFPIILSMTLFSAYTISYAQTNKNWSDLNKNGKKDIYENPNAPTDKRVADLLKQMTIEEKAAQMLQLDHTMVAGDDSKRKTNSMGYTKAFYDLDEKVFTELFSKVPVGSFLNGTGNPPEVIRDFMAGLVNSSKKLHRLGIPIIHGIDNVHGFNYVTYGTVFPHQNALGCTFDTIHSYNMGNVLAFESADLGLSWNFAPVCDLAVNPRFSRFYEHFSEDPILTGDMAVAYVHGFKNNNSPMKQALCAKHFLGYSNPHIGLDRTNAYITDQELQELWVPAYKRVFDAGVKTVMINSATINKQPVHASKKILQDLLRKQLKFDGMVVSDWNDISKLKTDHAIAADYEEAATLALNAGIDMFMEPMTLDFYEVIIKVVNEGRVSMERLDEAVGNILRLKFELGLFDPTYKPEFHPEKLLTKENRKKALKAAEDAIVLLKNDNNILPLNTNKILVGGPFADNKAAITGGWTLDWIPQSDVNMPKWMNTVKSGLEQEIGADKVAFEPNDKSLIEKTKKDDVVILALGEKATAESPGNKVDCKITAEQIELVKQLNKKGAKIAVVMLAARPLIITEIEPLVNAIVWAGRLGYEGGDAIAGILSGRVIPNGKLSFSYPRYESVQLPYHRTDQYSTESEAYSKLAEGKIDLYPFGHGLSYTEFKHSDFTISSKELTTNGTITASLKVTNMGKVAAKATVLWFISDTYGQYMRPNKILKKYEKQLIQPGETREFVFKIEPNTHLTYPDSDGKILLEKGEFSVSHGTSYSQKDRKYFILK